MKMYEVMEGEKQGQGRNDGDGEVKRGGMHCMCLFSFIPPTLLFLS